MFLIDFLVNALRLIFVDQWPITLTVVLGFAAIYRLLPRPQRVPILFGGVAAAAAVLAVSFLIVRVGGFTVETVLFYVFALVSIVAGGLLVTQRNPARAALAFALAILAVCGLFLLLAAPFLMAATIIVYAGAIIVTFLFVLMLAQQQGISDADGRSREPFLASATGFVLLGALLYLLHVTYGNDTAQWSDKLQPKAEKLQAVNRQIEMGKSPPKSEINEAVKENFEVVSAWRSDWEKKQDASQLETIRRRDPLGKALDEAWDDLRLPAEQVKQGQDFDQTRLLDLEDLLERIQRAAQGKSGRLSPLTSRADLEDPVRYFLQANREILPSQDPKEPMGTEPLIIPLRVLTMRTSLKLLALRELKSHPDPAKFESLGLKSLLTDFRRYWQKWQTDAKVSATDPTVVQLTEALMNAENSLVLPPVPVFAQAMEGLANAELIIRVNLEEVEKALERLRGIAVKTRAELRFRYEPMSTMSGPPSSVSPGELRRNEYGEPQLPAENAAYLGQSLFSDYLLAVEMGGMLLLVATVGAIAIATRHKSQTARPPVQVASNGEAPRRPS